MLLVKTLLGVFFRLRKEIIPINTPYIGILNHTRTRKEIEYMSCMY